MCTLIGIWGPGPRATNPKLFGAPEGKGTERGSVLFGGLEGRVSEECSVLFSDDAQCVSILAVT